MFGANNLRIRRFDGNAVLEINSLKCSKASMDELHRSRFSIEQRYVSLIEEAEP